MVRLAKCCNPLPGDEIIGYITRGRGITIHRKDCPNVSYYREEEANGSWRRFTGADVEGVYRVALEIEAIDRSRLAMDIMNVVADAKTTINAINARAISNNLALVQLKIEVKSLEQMRHVMDKIGRIRDVLEVRRVIPKKEH